jgi:hypothetical protein
MAVTILATALAAALVFLAMRRAHVPVPDGAV